MNDQETDPVTVQRVIRQHLETSRLLGVDVLPLRPSSRTAETAACPADSATPATVPATPRTPATAAADPSSSDRQSLLDVLRHRHDRECPHCTAVTTHTQTVFGEGNPCARLMFIGEAPGEEEDRTGRPFVGRAGKKLDEIINAMGLQRSDVYIANVLKARPPDNRTPTPDEAARCGPFLHEQIRIIQPRAIVTLGAPATKLILQTDVGITRIRGTWGRYEHGDVSIPVMPTFHPAYLLRQYTEENRRLVWSDMQAVLTLLRSEPG